MFFGNRRSLLGVRNLVPLCVLALITAPIPAAHAQKQTWLTQFGTSGDEGAWGLAPDGAGGAFVCGSTTGNLGAGPNAGGEDAFLARYDSAGLLRLLEQWGTPGFDSANGVATDGAGGVFVCGSTTGNLGGPNAGGIDAFLALADRLLNQSWIHQIGTSGDDEATAVAPDDAGGAFVTGWTSRDLGGPSAGGIDAWVGRYNRFGQQLWMRQWGSSGNESANALAPDGAGGVYVCGVTTGNLGGPNAGFFDAYVSHFDASGTRLWTTQFGTSDDEAGFGVAPDGAGGVYVCGATNGNLGGPNAGGVDAFVARLNSEGDLLWNAQFGTPFFDSANAVAADGAGSVMVAGTTEGSLGGPNAGFFDAFLANHDQAGLQQWIIQTGTELDDENVSVAIPLGGDSAGGVMVAGYTFGSLGGPNAGGADAFLALYTTGVCYADCDGNGVLDIFDFLCFQNSFVSGEPYACDCAPDPACDIFDFLCFQNAFVGGCP